MTNYTTILALLLVGASLAQACIAFDPDMHCPGDNGYAADDCDDKCYYYCEYRDAVVNATQQCCPPCLVWYHKDLTCVRDPNDVDCVQENNNVTTTQGPCNFLEGPNAYTYFVLGEEPGSFENCPVGTAFNVTLCGCQHDDTNPLTMNAQITCIDFETGWKNLAGSNGVYVRSANVTVSDNCNLSSGAGKCGYFNETAGSHMEVPIFRNAMGSYSEFSMSFFYKRTPNRPGVNSLVGNGNCGVESSLNVGSQVDEIWSNARSSNFTVYTSDTVAALDDLWHHVVVVYDGESITTYLDKENIGSSVFSGRIDRVYHGMWIGRGACTSYQFDGFMDTISFAKVAFNPSQVEYLYNNKNACLPL